MKQCRKCKKIKKVSEFHKKSDNKDGLRNYCIRCVKKIDAKQYDKIRKRPVLIGNKTRRQCRRCLEIFPTSIYKLINDKRYNKPRPDSYCPPCRLQHEYDRGIRRYGISVEEYEKLYKKQNGLCYICKKPEDDKKRRLSIDHDHNCCPGSKSCGKCIRGLLCHNCNHALGFVNDDIDILKSMITYLSKK